MSDEDISVNCGADIPPFHHKATERAKRGDVAGLSSLIEIKRDWVLDAESNGSYGTNILFFALQRGHPEIVKLLLDAKIDPNRTT